MFFRAIWLFALLHFWLGSAHAQTTPLLCATGAVNPPVRAEGISEQLGDILLNCSGGNPGSSITFNLAVLLNIGVSNRVSTAGITDVSLTVDTGSGPVPAGVPGFLQSSNAVSFNGITFTVPASRTVNLRISNLRGNASQNLGSQQPIQAFLSINGVPSPIVGNTNPLLVGVPARGLLSSSASSIIRCTGSPLPSAISFSSLLSSGTSFVSTRVSEGFPDAFARKAGSADSGVRIVASYSGLPAGARLFVPDVVAGSNASQPTAAGDLGGSVSGGAYTPGGSGSLLLARVSGADARGAGGSPVYVPGAPGSGTVVFNSVSEVRLVNGSGMAVYEVVDANPSARESAQLPTFLGMPQITDGSSGPIASEQISFGPISTVLGASATEPVPRFISLSPGSDCAALQDCNASYFPELSVTVAQPLQFTAQAGSALQTKLVQVNNRGGGALNWTASVTMSSGSQWLSVNPTAGVNNGTVFVNVFPQRLTPGVYSGTLTIDAGLQTGSRTAPVTLTVTAAPVTPAPQPLPPSPAPSPTVILESLTSAARPDVSSVAPGSLAILRGSRLSGASVAVTFDGLPATLLSSDPQSLTIQVPASLQPGILSQARVTVDGEASAALRVPILELAPEIFAGGVLNGDGSVNSETNTAPPGGALQIFSTGLLGAGLVPVEVKLHDRKLSPSWMGAAPGLVGVDQVNVMVPDDLPAMTTGVSVCGYAPSRPNTPVCSREASVTLR